ncbi:YiiX/YebB-like N1pC/P60 family cysteine hydrolase [Portibacter lacus]|uniref:Permuted papain-like amidase YaeF/Yiix C92 family enzyme n=1 Tax=Portibacter lacus TaxID=1099794 RepID=A0AA37SL87_9BACT|nr:YiiX/YebB-like N1pC/P60 family cysteine hydrolase [Portibacter lacus]GLR16538.1 hypothetical protein GCM10007940_11530 [Portibacter lacus]
MYISIKEKGIITIVYLLLLFVIIGCKDETFHLKEGDLLFQKWESSEFAKAINAVTDGYGDNDFAHVGMVINDEGTLKVFEATMSGGVGLTPLDTFLMASVTLDNQPNIAVGRLKSKYKEAIPSINNWVLNQLDKPYDTLFIYGNQKYYCSELIHDAFNTNAGDTIFQLAPMTFKDPRTNEFFSIWVDYFEAHRFPIPEGEPGINPGLMSKSSKLEIVHEYFD